MRRRGTLPLIVIVLVAAGSLIWTVAAGNTPQLGLDLQGGFSVVLTAQESASDDAVQKAMEIIRRRIDGLGVAEPEVTRQGKNVVIQLPGVKDRKKAQQIVGRTAKLEFRPVLIPTLPYDKSKPTDPCGKARAAIADWRAPRRQHRARQHRARQHRARQHRARQRRARPRRPRRHRPPQRRPRQARRPSAPGFAKNAQARPGQADPPTTTTPTTQAPSTTESTTTTSPEGSTTAPPSSTPDSAASPCTSSSP